MPKKFSYPITFLHCRDLQEIRSFYEDILHLQVALEQDKCIIYRIGEKSQNAYWGFCDLYSEFLEHPEMVCLTLVVDTREEVDAWHSELVSKKVICIKPPGALKQFGIYNAFYRDPMNHTIEIQVFDEDSKIKLYSIP
ncbi:VOC family protein [Promethearchaeum syntrophicum]|uniref:VOC family protein n=1 Tax=Promethearchaeum syntrophicum TaxID=2594042 RepID=A0A5B9D6F9_9ARCH|nr:VOC family protein [Candidatus Prometheoarchaeum syntrophicum]QEE14583.1 Glyoxalase-like domain protein [Candidatus Prometheoarchaeum syntrophicum]